MEAIKVNVWIATERLFKFSSVVRRGVKNGSLVVIGAIYDIDSGQVDWMGNHPAQQELLST